MSSVTPAELEHAHEDEDNTDFSTTAAPMSCRSHTTAATRRWAALRYGPVNIDKTPGTVTIDSAEIVFTTDAGKADDANLDIHCEDVDDSVDFATTADVTGRALTTASTAWVADNLGPTRTSPNFASAVQEVIDRAGWTSGNDLCVILKPKTNADKTFSFYADDARGDCDLTIVYHHTISGVVGAPQTITVSASGVRTVNGVAAIASTPQIAATGVRTVLGTAAMVVTDVLTAAGLRTVHGTATVGSTPQITANGQRTVFGSAAIDVAVSIAASVLQLIADLTPFNVTVRERFRQTLTEARMPTVRERGVTIGE